MLRFFVVKWYFNKSWGKHIFTYCDDLKHLFYPCLLSLQLLYGYAITYNIVYIYEQDWHAVLGSAIMTLLPSLVLLIIDVVNTPYINAYFIKLITYMSLMT